MTGRVFNWIINHQNGTAESQTIKNGAFSPWEQYLHLQLVLLVYLEKTKVLPCVCCRLLGKVPIWGPQILSNGNELSHRGTELSLPHAVPPSQWGCCRPRVQEATLALLPYHGPWLAPVPSLISSLWLPPPHFLSHSLINILNLTNDKEIK